MGTYHSNIPDYMDHYPGAGFLKPLLQIFFRHQYYFLQRLYVPTPFIKNIVSEQYDYKMDNLGVWGRGVDLSKFDPRLRSYEWRKSLGITESEVVIAWVGRLFPEKRPDIFAEVVRRLHEDGVPFRAIVIGSGPCEQEMQDLPNTQFLGWMGGRDLSIAYASSDIFLFPSAVETFGNVSLEAAASGVPVIVEGGCSGHVVRNEVTGFSCSGDDVDEWYAATRKLVTDHNLRQKMSAASREFSLEFENSRVINKMIQNYEEVSEEFHDRLGSNHSNRDEAVGRKVMESGVFPRPLIVQLVELILTVLTFFVGWLSWFSKMCSSICRPCRRKVDKIDDTELPMLHEPEKNKKPSKQSTWSRIFFCRNFCRCFSITNCVCAPLFLLGDSWLMYFISHFLLEVVLVFVRIESFIRSGCCCVRRRKNPSSPSSWTDLSEQPPRKRKMSDHTNLIPVELPRKRKNSDFKTVDLSETDDSSDGVGII